MFYNNLCRTSILCILCKRTAVRLTEVGRLTLPKSEGKYEIGQLFFHRILGYRGVILHPWLARINDQVVVNKSETENTVEKNLEWKTHIYYETLMDKRDYKEINPFIRVQTEAVNFFNNRDIVHNFYTITGLDYVAQDDILPYIASEKQPIKHELFDKFFKYYPNKDPPFRAQRALHTWQKKNQYFLKLLDVYKDTTENIEITVIPFYVGNRESKNTCIYWWRYSIRLENIGKQSVQVKEHHWRTFSRTFETVCGKEVLRQELVLSKKLPAFQYTSHVSIQAPNGYMSGRIQMEREDGLLFDCRVPLFLLENKPKIIKAL